jgi:hypothetical protein
LTGEFLSFNIFIANSTSIPTLLEKDDKEDSSACP